MEIFPNCFVLPVRVVPSARNNTWREVPMRIAVLILALVLMIVLAFQSIAFIIAVDFAGQADNAGSFGLLIAFLWLLGAAFVLAKPGIAEWCFLASAAIAFVVLKTTPTAFTDLNLWGSASVLLSFGCQLGKRELRRAKS